MAELTTGELLEHRYRIEAPIARGGMSTVYRCVDTRLGRYVAAKVMDSKYVKDPVFRQRFQREARSMAQLSHPCLVGVYDFGASDDTMFLIMELITGGTLRELLAERGPMPPHAAAAVMRQVLTGLRVAHEAGMVHRDLKPDNVLINGDHQVKLGDFGLVRAASRAQADAGHIVGTVSYLSPEQVTGDELTPASDVYSAGLLLFELLTGSTPFAGDSRIDHAYARLDNPVPAPSSRIHGVPEAFDTLVANATAIPPSQRYADAGEFLDAVQRTSSDLALPAFVVPVPTNAAAHRASAFLDPGLTPSELLTTEVPRPTAAPAPSWDETTVMGTRPEAPEDHYLTHLARNGHDALDTYDTRDVHDAHEGGETAVFAREEESHGTDPTRFDTPFPPHRPGMPPNPADHTIAEPGYPQAGYAAPGAPATQAYDAHRVPAPQHAPRTDPNVRGRKPLSNRNRLFFGIWLVLVAAAVAAVALGGWWFGSGRYGEIPQVLGMEQAAATQQIEQAGFGVTTEGVYNNAPKGQVLGTSPSEGERAVLGSEIALRVSLGRPSVPTLGADTSVEAVTRQLRERTLTARRGGSEYHDTVPTGHVIALQPKSGTQVDAESSVTMTISKGPRPIRVPSLRNQSAQTVQEQLERAGLRVTVQRRFDPEIKGGTVIETSPNAGTLLPKGSSITVVVSTAIEMPRVIGLSEQEARAALADAGIQVAGTERIDRSSEHADDVVGTSPTATTLLDPASASVTLQLPQRVRVPIILGKKVSDAITALEAEGLSADVDATDPDARVVWQSPAAGSVELGATVRLRTLP